MGKEPKPKTEQEKRERQAAKLKELRERLAADYDALNGQLSRGGDFRDGEDLNNAAWLFRWLRARCWVVPKAEECIRQHAKWRAAFCPSGRIHESEVANELAANKLFLQGLDKKGRAVIVVLARNHSAWTRDISELERVSVYCIDALLDAVDPSVNPDRVMTFIFDLSDFGMSNVDLTAMIKLFHVINNHFVERLGRCFIYNAGVVFEGSWKVFSPMLDEVTMRKISFISPKDHTPLHAEVPREILPPAYGGTGQLIPVTQAVADTRRRNGLTSNGVKI